MGFISGWERVSRAGDVDKDGWGDVIVGAHNDDNKGSNSGMARVFAGKTGAIVRTLNGDSAGDLFGQSVGYIGDINNDLHSEVIVGAYMDDNAGTNSGMARVFDGKTGNTIWTINGDSAGDGFGGFVAYAGDVNKDGTPDFVVGACQDDNNGTDSGSARAFSGKTGTALWTVNGNAAGDAFGHPVNYAGDVNKDGHDDVIVGAYGNDKGGTDAGMAKVISGKDAKVLHSFFGSSRGDDLGIGVCAAGDVNGDGYGDVVVGADLVDKSASNAGQVTVHSGVKLSLTTDKHAISLTSPSSQTMSIDAGSTHAGRLYWVFGSFTGTSPGTQLSNLLVPLNYDLWTLATFQSANSTLLKSFRGTLNANGRATAVLTVPTGQPTSLAGLTLHHAFVVYNSSSVFFMASNPMPMTLVQ